MKDRIQWFTITVIIVVLLCQEGTAQESRSGGHQDATQSVKAAELDDGDFNLGESILTILFPRGVRDTWRLKRYLRSEKFSYIKEKVGDVRAIDAILRRALEVSHDDVSEALFISALATMEHRKVGVRLPLIKLPIYLPLTTEDDSTFRARVTCLPSHFYSDSPRGAYGDKDKLQHFFGSAFLAYCFHSRGVANFVGDFVEWGEDEFIIDGVADPRDRRANRQGQELGIALSERREANPSDFLRIELVLTGSRTDW